MDNSTRYQLLSSSIVIGNNNVQEERKEEPYDDEDDDDYDNYIRNVDNSSTQYNGSLENDVIFTDDEMRNLNLKDGQVVNSLIQRARHNSIPSDYIVTAFVLNGTDGVRVLATSNEIIYALPYKVWGEFNMDMGRWLENVEKTFWFADKSYALIRIRWVTLPRKYHRYLASVDMPQQAKMLCSALYMNNFHENDCCHTDKEYYKLKNNGQRTLWSVLYDMLYVDWKAFSLNMDVGFIPLDFQDTTNTVNMSRVDV